MIAEDLPKRRHKAYLLGVLFIALGSLILIATGTYYGYAVLARSQLDKLTFSGEGSSVSEKDAIVASTHDFLSLYPGDKLNPKYWGAPLWAGTDPYEMKSLPEGFIPLNGHYSSLDVGDLSAAERMEIPIIGVNSEVRDLAILDLGSSRAYETPKKIVGHIPGTANPGEPSNGWYFGHLENPLAGGGNVFQDLPKIAQHLRQGDRVYVLLKNREDTTYLYEAVSARVVHERQIQLSPSDTSIITLVTCVPRMVYDHRLLITANLVGLKEPSAADDSIRPSATVNIP
ncbi:MAG: sortase [Chloroflexi bacterium]|nr:sortase [Chloroflexota bacterium]